jgi:gamma-glutamylcyclotransferase (GGCT)/AIG2-like uncharacterized protein YtfP
MAAKLTKLFVYGTLMQEHRNHHFMQKGGAKFVGDAVTRDALYEMKLLESRSSPGRFSPVVVNESDAHIAGEVYEVDDKALYTIDTFEGSRYERREVQTSVGPAYMYVYCAKGERFMKKSDPDYKAHIKFDKSKRIYSWWAENPAQESELGLQA